MGDAGGGSAGDRYEVGAGDRCVSTATLRESRTRLASESSVAAFMHEVTEGKATKRQEHEILKSAQESDNLASLTRAIRSVRTAGLDEQDEKLSDALARLAVMRGVRPLVSIDLSMGGIYYLG